MLRRIICLSFIIIAVPALCTDTRTTGQRPSTKRVGACRVEEVGAYHALGEISEKANVAIGVDAVQPEKEPSIALDFPGGTVGDLLNMFIAQAVDYTWTEANDGVIHVTRTDAHVSVLDVVMAYPGADRRTRQQIWEDISKRPEVAAWMNSARCSRREFFHGGKFKTHNDPISIAPGPITLEQLLDEVAVRSGANYWAVLQSPPTSGPCRVAIILW